ncbi:unnamed protein product [Dovyalis caffra]|uniref:GPI ethanolamine phosphate transferase 1 n=1 Tax=Dovyalis caffra TaxID=77055 RepID=A0AAV1R6J9_9ROSI|nr:unnamed protein product [Dovyalis caffra]
MMLSQNLRSLALKGLHYFQTYDWLMLMTVVTLGYVGISVWMSVDGSDIYFIIHGTLSSPVPCIFFHDSVSVDPDSRIASGAIIVIVGAAARWLDQHSEGNKYWLRICCHKLEKPSSPVLFCLQALLIGLSSVMVALSTSHRTEKQELHAVHQLINWSIAGFSMVLPLFSEKSLLSRLNSIFLGFAPTFLLLSIGYEAVFYGALALVLMAWILFENTILHLTKVKKLSASLKNTREKAMLENDVRYLQLSDVRIPLIFAKKLYVDDTKKKRRVEVRNTGSWMEIGNSISHFGIVSAQVVFVLLLFALTNTYTKDIRIGSSGSLSQKAA